MSTPYLGSKISLISRLDIRYEGILYTVDSNESTIALAKVRSFGTENRPTDHPVKARDEVYEYIIFKASDIKDLVVCEAPKEADSGDVFDDPAIVSVSKPPTRSEPPQNQLSTAPKSSPPASQQAKQKPSNQQQQSSHQPPPPYHQKQQQQQSWQPSNNRYQQQQSGGYPNQRQGNRPLNAQQQPQQSGGYNNQRQNNPRPFNRAAAPKEKLKFDTDFDFEESNQQFKEKLDDLTNKLDEVDFNAEEEQNSADENEEEVGESCYDKKSSFFDSISCESQEKADGKNTRPDWRKERQTNTETFGPNAVRSQAYLYRNRFNNQNRFHGNRPQHQQQEGGGQRFVPRQQNNNAGQGGFKPRYNNNNNSNQNRFQNNRPQDQQQF